MNCRTGCGACCIAPSISSPIPGMADGKPAGVRCIQLDSNNLCRLFNNPTRPRVCIDFKPTPEICSVTSANALSNLDNLEKLTK